MANTAANVSVGMPRTTGGIYRAPAGTTLPTDASTALSEAFISLGYIAEDGVTNSNTIESDDYKAWGGDVVISYQTEKTDTFQFGMIESMNMEVLKTVYGDSNVTGALATGITVRANAQELTEHVYVIDQILRGGALMRIVIPNGKVTEIGDIVYQDEEVINFQVTITGLADSDGDTHKTYIKSA